MKNIIGKIKKKGSAYFKIRNVAEAENRRRPIHTALYELSKKPA